MSSAVSANRLELLQVADAVAREKLIDKELVIEALEEAIQKAARSRYGMEHDIRTVIDRNTGDIRLYRVVTVTEAEEIENESAQLTLEDAQAQYPDETLEMGSEVREELPPMDFGRIAAQTAKQVITQKVRDAERDRQFEEYKDRANEVTNGIVKRVEYGNVVIDLGRAEAVIRRDEGIPRENLRTGDRVRAFIFDVRSEPRGPQIFLSRTRPEFMAELFAQEVPEIYDGIITIKSVARDPGSRAKIAVTSSDSGIDPVGACVGMRGSRVQAVVNELQGEKIDIIQWSPDAASFIVNALAPAEVEKVVLDEDNKRIEVVVPDDQLSLAIGRRGQNVRLASQLTGWVIDILTEAEESERRQTEFVERSTMFTEALDVEETIGQLLVAEGFGRLEEVAFVPLAEIALIEGFDDEIAEELQARAVAALAQRDADFDDTRKGLGVVDDIAAIDGIIPEMLVVLGNAGIKTLDDLGDLASDELTDAEEGILKEFDLDEEQANAIIMAARAHWFDDEEDAAAVVEDEAVVVEDEAAVVEDISEAEASDDSDTVAE
jgi:N utilization substance protein A